MCGFFAVQLSVIEVHTADAAGRRAHQLSDSDKKKLEEELGPLEWLGDVIECEEHVRTALHRCVLLVAERRVRVRGARAHRTALVRTASYRCQFVMMMVFLVWWLVID